MKERLVGGGSFLEREDIRTSPILFKAWSRRSRVVSGCWVKKLAKIKVDNRRGRTFRNILGRGCLFDGFIL